MDYEQLEALFQPQGTGQVYYSPTAPAGTYPVGAKPLSEAPPEIQFRYQQQVRNKPIGDIAPSIITDYTRSKMTLGPTTYTREAAIAGKHEEREQMQEYRLNRHPVLKANPATSTAVKDYELTASTQTSQERLDAMDKDVLPQTAEEKLKRKALIADIGKQEEKRLSDAKKFFEEGLLTGRIKQDPGEGLKILQKKKVKDAFDKETEIEEYGELPTQQQYLFTQLLKKGLIDPKSYGLQGVKVPGQQPIGELLDPMSAGAQLPAPFPKNYGAASFAPERFALDPTAPGAALPPPPNRGLVGSAMDAVRQNLPGTMAGVKTSMMDTAYNAANLIPRATNLIGGAQNSILTKLFGDSYSPVADVPMWMNRPEETLSGLTAIQIAELRARDPYAYSR